MKNENVTIGDVYNLIEKFRKEVKDTYVTKGEFKPVKMITYGFVIIIVSAVATAMVAQVVIAR